jgi:hypothetical protein
LLRNHHAFESKVAAAQVAQVNRVARENQVARERPDGLRVVLQTALQAARAPKDADLKAALQAKDHAVKDADLKADLRVKDHAAKARAAKDADLKAALRAKDHAAKDADLKVDLRAKAHGAKDAGLKADLRVKDHGAKDADLKGVRLTVLQEALAQKDQAEKECGVRIPNDSSSGPWNSIVMAMASSIATS